MTPVLRAATVAMAFVLTAPALAQPFDHAAWTQLLERYVDDDGRVAYRDLAAQDRSTLDSYLAQLAAARPNDWPRAERIAFWLNAYNATIVNAVLAGYSAETLLSRYSLFYRYEQTVAGEARTANDIEHRIVRPSGENRIHFALVCASSSCPKLLRRAWIGATLDRDLGDAARRFVQDPTRNQIGSAEAPLQLSMIFKWYRDDFGGTDDTVREFVGRYLAPPEQRWVQERRPAIEYRAYDWTMNAQPGQRPE